MVSHFLEQIIISVWYSREAKIIQANLRWVISFFFFLMVALWLLGCKSIALGHFKIVSAESSVNASVGTHFRHYCCMLGLQHHTYGVNLDFMAIVQGWDCLSLWKLLLSKIFCISPDRGWVFQPPFHWGEIPSRAGAQLQPLLLRDESQAGSPAPVDTNTVALASGVCRLPFRASGHQLMAFRSSFHISSFFASKDFSFFL